MTVELYMLVLLTNMAMPPEQQFTQDELAILQWQMWLTEYGLGAEA